MLVGQHSILSEVSYFLSGMLVNLPTWRRMNPGNMAHVIMGHTYFDKPGQSILKCWPTKWTGALEGINMIQAKHGVPTQPLCSLNIPTSNSLGWYLVLFRNFLSFFLLALPFTLFSSLPHPPPYSCTAGDWTMALLMVGTHSTTELHFQSPKILSYVR